MSARKQPRVVEVVFRLTDDRYPFVRLSGAEDCRFELLKLLLRGEGRYAEFFSVTDADPAVVRERARAAELADARLLAERDAAGLFVFEVTGDSPIADLARMEGIPRTVRSEGGQGRIEAEIVPPPDPAEVVAEYQDAHPDAGVVEITETDRSAPLFTRREFAETLEDRLTDRQMEVLEAAYEAGYYERPRETTGQELADQLGITVATFSQHVRVAERRILSLLFENDLFSDPAL